MYLTGVDKVDSTIARLHSNALQHSRQAARLWLRARNVLDSKEFVDLRASIHEAVELNQRAAGECRKDLNMIDVLRRYFDPRPRGDQWKTDLDGSRHARTSKRDRSQN